MQNRFWEKYREGKRRINPDFEYNNVWGSVLLSEADSFIEFCFERSCSQMKNGMEVLNEWRYHKSQYCKLTSTTAYDFQHYSRHDATHSINILEAIEMVLGVERIVLLSRGDLWLLLETAYSHDIGMTLTGEELCDLWKEEGFKDYLLSNLNGKGISQKQAVEYYKQMDNLIHQRAQMEGLEQSNVEKISFGDCWPAKISNYVEWILADYVRSRHGERIGTARDRIFTLKDSEIPLRLYHLVTIISGIHTENFEEINKKLEFEAKGMGAETLHPRFAAAMLRLGDVLDTDNNRFFSYALEHELEIPIESLYHIGKHESIKHMQISTEEIRLTAEATDINVCKEASLWFRWVDKEVNFLISNWNRVAPIELKGCTLQPSVCKVFLRDPNGNRTEYSVEHQQYFEVNKQKLIQLLVGNNIYDMQIDFVREYLQNAMDAVKMQIWQDIQNGEYEDLINEQVTDLKKLMPYDLDNKIYERNKIKLRIEVSKDRGVAYLIIEDAGIGMEEECIRVISAPGTGWRGRKRYNKVITQMPSWLYPTGGFGIGLQSAFMAADRVIIDTQTCDETLGRRIIMESPQKSGMISRENISLKHHGTRVCISVPIDIFMSWNRNITHDQKKTEVFLGYVDYNEQAMNMEIDTDDIIEQDYFSPERIEEYIRRVLKVYLEQIIPGSVIPIVVYSNNYKSMELKPPQTPITKMKGEVFTISRNQREYRVIFSRSEVAFWDCEEHIYFIVRWKEDASERDKKGCICYKSIRMTKERIPERSLYENFVLFVDYMGFKADNVLKVHRNEFAEDFDRDSYIRQFFKIYFWSINNIEQRLFAVPNDLKFRLTELILADSTVERELVVNEISKLCLAGTHGSKILKYFLVPERAGEEVLDEADGQIRTNEQIVFSYKIEEVDIIDLCNDYIELMRGREEHFDNSTALCLSRAINDAGQTVKEVETRYREAHFVDWVNDHMQYDGCNYVMKKDDTIRDVFYHMIVSGVYVQDEICKWLAEELADYQEEYRVYLDSQLQNQDAQPLRSVVLFRKNLSSTTEIDIKDEKELCKRLLAIDKINRSYLVYPKLLNCYEELCVNALPYAQENTKNELYIISPISTNWKRQFKTYDLFRSEIKIELQDFINDITSEEEFDILIEWVAAYAVNSEYCHNKRAVREKYEELLTRIYSTQIEVLVGKRR